MALLCACAGPQPEVHEYHDLKVTLVCADNRSIAAACHNASHDDEGNSTRQLVPWFDGVSWYSVAETAGCFVPGQTPEVWLPMGKTCDIIAHEFCHWNDYAGGRRTQADAAKCERDFEPWPL